MNWFVEALKKYAVFNGRARRKEFWLFNLFVIITYAVFMIVGAVIDAPSIVVIPGLAFLLPSLAVTSRRLHDTGRTGWWFFFGAVPIAGPITLLVFYCTDSQAGDNRYGPNPKTGPVYANAAVAV